MKRQTMQRISSAPTGHAEWLMADIRDLHRAFPESQITLTPEGGGIVLRCEMAVDGEGENSVRKPRHREMKAAHLVIAAESIEALDAAKVTMRAIRRVGALLHTEAQLLMLLAKGER